MPGLSGVRIVVTRAAHQAEELAAPLRSLGAQVLLAPTIGIGPPLDNEPLQRAAAKATEYEWIVFTSTNAVAAFAAALRKAGVVVASLPASVAVVGESTRKAAAGEGFRVSLTPSEQIAESLVAAFASGSVDGRSILYPSAAVTRDVLATGLQGLGARVDVVEAYRNVLPPEAATQTAAVFRDPLPDWVTFASSSAAKNTAALVPSEVLRRVRIASIGPATTHTLLMLGLTPDAEANPHSVDGLVSALLAFQAAL